MRHTSKQARCSKWPSSKAADSEKAEAYDSTLRPSSANGAKSATFVSPKAENAAGGHFEQPAKNRRLRLPSPPAAGNDSGRHGSPHRSFLGYGHINIFWHLRYECRQSHRAVFCRT